MIRIMENTDLAQCGMIYSKAFPMEHPNHLKGNYFLTTKRAQKRKTYLYQRWSSLS